MMLGGVNHLPLLLGSLSCWAFGLCHQGDVAKQHARGATSDGFSVKEYVVGADHNRMIIVNGEMT